MDRTGRTAWRSPRRAGVAATLLALAVPVASGLAACSAVDRPAAGDGSGGATERTSAAAHEKGSRGSAGTILQPGRPGEPAETLPPGTTLPADRYNRADVRFVQMMIVHHTQALEMGRLARSRARDPQVAAMAQRIADAQGAEILSLSAWLHRHRLDVPTRQDYDHHMRGDVMRGMLTQAEMDRLANARGSRFDAMYLRSMIRHHDGAVMMASQVMNGGRAIVVGEVAADVSAGQQAEIGRMRALLKQS